MNNGSAIIETASLVKNYGQVRALNGLSLTVPPKTVFGILGPNGAGKTTLVGVMTTLIKPDEGTAMVSGLDVTRKELKIRALIGVVPQENNLDRMLTARENLYLHGLMHGMKKRAINEAVDHYLNAFGLYGRRHDFPDTFSIGMQRRLTVARAFVHNPHILFLDEPTTGLDPQSRRMVWDFVLSLKEQRTFVLTTHYMEEAERLCDEIVIIDKGSIIVQGRGEDIKKDYKMDKTKNLEDLFLEITGREVRDC